MFESPIHVIAKRWDDRRVPQRTEVGGEQQRDDPVPN
jgi:hypothetical protein